MCPPDSNITGDCNALKSESDLSSQSFLINLHPPSSGAAWLWCLLSRLLRLKWKESSDSHFVNWQGSPHYYLAASEKSEDVKVLGNGSLPHGQLWVSSPVPWKTH